MFSQKKNNKRINECLIVLKIKKKNKKKKLFYLINKNKIFTKKTVSKIPRSAAIFDFFTFPSPIYIPIF